jgi:hypothetical protein
MTRPRLMQLAVVALAGLVTAVGCGRDTSTLDLAPLDTDPTVFIDVFPAGVDYYAFMWSKYDALETDLTGGHENPASLKVNVPDRANVDGGFAGGAFVARNARDLSGYNALTFWAKASRPEVFDVVGFANDNTGTSKYQAGWSNIALTTEWQKFTVPIPLPARLSAERGLFYFADAVPEESDGYTAWFDEVQFEKVGAIYNPRPYMASGTVNTFVGAKIAVDTTKTTFYVAGTDETIDHFPGYFTYYSSDKAVADVVNGEITVTGPGDADITAKLDTVTVSGTVTLSSSALPTTAAPTPTVPATDVVSLFSDAYVDVAVETWAVKWMYASWDVEDIEIAGDDVKVYPDLGFAGIIIADPVDVSQMTYMHIDVFVYEGTEFKVKLVDFDPYGNLEWEVVFNDFTDPRFYAGEWVSLEIPMSSFLLGTMENIGQVILSGQRNTVFIDNIYWHR